MQQKWNYLKVKFKNELACEMRFADNYKSNWYLYKHMEFMKDYYQQLLQNEPILPKYNLHPMKVNYSITLLEEIRKRPNIWISVADPSEEEISEIEQSWEDIGNALEKICKSFFLTLSNSKLI